MGLRGTLFPVADETAIVAELRADRLVAVAGQFFPDLALSDDYLYQKLLAAEADASRRLRCLFVPTIMVPEGTSTSVTDQYTTDGTPWQLEPAYDWRPDFFQGNQWGWIQTRQRPIISVSDIRFVYPSTANQAMYIFPAQWLKLDLQYGNIELVPAGDVTSLPLNAYLLSVFGGGRSIPHILQVSYTAGLEDAPDDYPDLLDLIKRMAVLRVVQDQFLPQSGSVSADGLSQSLSVDVDKYQTQVDNRLETLRESLHGVRMGFL